MSASSATKLYSPVILALATELSNFPPLQNATLQGEVVSRTCGSKIVVNVNPTANDEVGELGFLATACAIGQASAVIFAQHARGLDILDIQHALSEIESWLGNGSIVPAWPDIAALDQARLFPARHEAIVLPWRAAIAALSKH